MKQLRYVVMVLVVVCNSAAYAERPCPFDSINGTYQGTREEQSRCLLRQVKRFGKLADEAPLPRTIASKIEKNSVDITLEELQRYLDARHINQAEIGGPLTTPLNSKTRYFIIHDTSAPNLRAGSFPAEINNASWKGNNLSLYSPKAHVYINRVGASVTKVNFNVNHRTTKFELLDGKRRNLYVGIELVQPRRSYPESSQKNDALAPVPGFPPAQLERLAVVYVAAAVRAGNYLIPAFHSVIDAGLKDGHDDPQNFDLKAWDDALYQVLLDILAAPHAQ